MVKRSATDEMKKKLKEHAKEIGHTTKSKHMRRMRDLLDRHPDKSFVQVHKMVRDEEKAKEDKSKKLKKERKGTKEAKKKATLDMVKKKRENSY